MSIASLFHGIYAYNRGEWMYFPDGAKYLAEMRASIIAKLTKRAAIEQDVGARLYLLHCIKNADTEFSDEVLERELLCGRTPPSKIDPELVERSLRANIRFMDE